MSLIISLRGTETRRSGRPNQKVTEVLKTKQFITEINPLLIKSSVIHIRKPESAYCSGRELPGVSGFAPTEGAGGSIFYLNSSTLSPALV